MTSINFPPFFEGRRPGTGPSVSKINSTEFSAFEDAYNLCDNAIFKDTYSPVWEVKYSTLAALAYTDNMLAQGIVFPETVLDVMSVGSVFACDAGEFRPLYGIRVVSAERDTISVRTELIDEHHQRVVAIPHGRRFKRSSASPQHLLREDIERLVLGLMQDEFYQPSEASVAGSVIAGIASTFTGAGGGNNSTPEIQKVFELNANALRTNHNMSPLEAFRWCVRNWKNLRNSPIWNHVSNLLAIGIVLGFAPEKWGKLEINSIKIFQLTQGDKYTDALSIIDGIMAATEYFVEAAVASWEVGNFLPFFFERHMATKMDELYEELQQLIPEVLNGDFRKRGGNWSEVLLKIEQAKKAFSGARDCAPARSLQRKILQDRVLMINMWHYQLVSCIKAGDVVKQPYCNITVGPPRAGKTRFTRDLIRIHATVIGLDFSPEMVANMTPGDEFHSQVFNHTVYLIYDDIAANKPKYDKAMGIVGIIQSVNNMRFVAVKAEAELKGKIMPELGAVMGTANTEEMNSHVFANTKEALYQRYVKTLMRILPEWANAGGGVNVNEVDLKCNTYVEYGGVKYKDIARYDICISDGEWHRVAVVRDPTTGVEKRLADLNVAEAYYWHEVLMRIHDKRQTEHVARLRNEVFNVCPKCRRITCVCTTESEQGNGEQKCAPVAHANYEVTLEPKPLVEDEETDEGGANYFSYFRDSFRPHSHDPVPSRRPRTNERDGVPRMPTIPEQLWDDPLPTDRRSEDSFFDFLTPSEDDDPDETIQGAFADAAWSGFRAGVSKYFTANPAQPMWVSLSYGICSPFWWGYAADNLTQELLAFAAVFPSYQWWWWVPESWWKLPFMPHLSQILMDDQLRIAVKAHYNLMKYGFPTGFLYLTWAYIKFEWWHMACTIPTIVFIWFLFWWVVNAYNYRYCAYSILTHKRDLMGHLRDATYAKMTPYFRGLLMAVSGIAGGYVLYRGFNFLYKEFIVDEPRAPDVPNEIPNPTFHVGADQSAASGLTHMEVYTDYPGCMDRAKKADTDAEEKISFSAPSVAKTRTSNASEARQGFMSVSSQQVAVRENEVDVWKRMTVEKRATYRPPHGMTSEQMLAKAVRGLVSVYHKNELDEWSFRCDAYFYDTGMCIMGAQDTPKYTQTWLLVRGPAQHDRRTMTVSPLNFVELPGGKLSIGKLCFSSFAPVRTYFNHLPTQLEAIYCQRLEDGKLRNPVPVSGTLSVAANGTQTIRWQFPRETQVGMCGGIYFSTGSKPGILGVHYAGYTQDLTIGISMVPTPEMFKLADEKFMAKPGVLLPLAFDPHDVSVTIAGKTLVRSGDAPKGSIIDQTTWLRENDPNYPAVEKLSSESRFDNTVYPDAPTLPPEESPQPPKRVAPAVETVSDDDPDDPPGDDPDETVQGCIYVGKYPTSAFYKSRAVATLIAESVKSDFPDFDFGKPRFGRGMWPKGAAHAFASTPGLPREQLEWAILDYISIFDKNPIPSALLKTLRPLTWEEVVNGIDKVKFIDALNWSTSMGAGFPGGKRSWVTTFLDSLGHEKKDFVEVVWEQVRLAYEAFDRGERVPFLFVATPKDEPTPVDKEKVRLFMVGEIASILICRKYYTPVIRLLQMLPGWSECCVGLNATSPHWEDLWKRFEKFPNVFDGDYSKYDLSMNADINESSYWIMIYLASKGQYTALDLYYMACIAIEMIFSMCAYKRDVVIMCGSTPSGIPVTVNINSLDNSLINRCAYKFAYPDAEIGEFRNFVSHGNYGDDFINAVANERAAFNFITMRDYLAAFGVKITPGIKDAEGQPFVVSLDMLVFLQRFSSRLPELSYRVGKLSEKSILRMLLCVMQGKRDWDLAAATAENVDTALREWVYHGEEIYEKRRAWLTEIVEKHNIRHLCRVIDTPYLELLTSLQEEWM